MTGGEPWSQKPTQKMTKNICTLLEWLIFLPVDTIENHRITSLFSLMKEIDDCLFKDYKDTLN
jgi:hypothetical protein